MKLKLGLAALAAVGISGVLVAGCCFPSGLSSKIGDQVGKSVENSVKKSVGAESATSTGNKDANGSDIATMPRYDGSLRVSYAKVTINGAETITIGYTMSADEKTVWDWYKTQLPAKGWKVDSTLEDGSGGGLMSASMSNKTLALTVSKETSDNKTKVEILYGTKAAGSQ
jgi:hypothetical protein